MSKEKNAWQKYLEKNEKSGLIENYNNREAKPWDLINPKIKKIPESTANKRYEICKRCPEFKKLTGQCSICHCFMSAKVKLPDASCPLHKWESYYNEDNNGIL